MAQGRHSTSANRDRSYDHPPDFATAVEEERAVNPAFSRRYHREREPLKPAGFAVAVIGIVLSLIGLGIPGLIVSLIAQIKARGSSYYAPRRQSALIASIVGIILALIVIVVQVYVLVEFRGEIATMEARYQAALAARI